MINLRPYQKEAISSIKEAWLSGFKKVLLVLPTGCHAKGQRVLKYTGHLVKVEDIKAGDQLMGADSTPRTVLEVIVSEDDIYRVKSTRDRNEFLLGGNHLFSIIDTSNNKDVIKDVPIRHMSFYSKYLLNNHIKMIMAPILRVGNPYKNKLLEPYMLGIKARKDMDIKEEYFRMSFEDRIEFIKGFMVHLKNNKGNPSCFFPKKNVNIRKDLGRLCDSVFLNHGVICDAGLIIKGFREKPFLRIIKSIEKEAVGTCYGFHVSGDRRYLMEGNIITHNCGKTIVFNSIASDIIKDGGKVLIIAHREELINQAIEKFLKIDSGIDFSLEKESSIGDLNHQLIFASKDSLCIEKRLNRYPKDFFDLIIVDEAHHIVSDTYMRIVNHFSESKLLGVTATPDRADQKKLSEVFEIKAFEYELPDAIKDGWLSNIIARTANISVDISKVKNSSGDFSVGELEDAISPYFSAVSKYLMKHTPNRKIVVFTPRIDGAIEVAKAMSTCGFNVTHISGKDKDRKEKLEAFSNNKIKVLTCSLLLNEGWDEPSVDCIVNLRPTQSFNFYKQAMGRGTRLMNGKENLLLFDLIWKSNKEIFHPSKLIAENEAVANAMRDFLISNCNNSYNLVDLHYIIDCILFQAKMEEARKIAQVDLFKKNLKNFKTFAFLSKNDSLLNYEPIFHWEFQPISEKQIEFLTKVGIFMDKKMNKGFANRIVDAIIKRREKGLCTPKQLFFLAKMGIVSKCIDMPFEEASAIMDSISKSYWKPNSGIKKKYVDIKNPLSTPLVDYSRMKLKPIMEGDKKCPDNSII
ncbi:MAG: DEAD/DEAH box helicase family protein [Melioribacteraceae bacterium]|nr:DEAD/DEAH box helicase family protein [Melioribacteraceae bacterium]